MYLLLSHIKTAIIKYATGNQELSYAVLVSNYRVWNVWHSILFMDFSRKETDTPATGPSTPEKLVAPLLKSNYLKPDEWWANIA
jgi:hypothetical protein